MADWGNPFLSDEGARRYARFRPDFAPHLIRVLEASLPRVRLALDVAAGTGISAAAVAARADRVVAIDVSPAMVAAAPRAEHTSWLIAGAEALPFRDATFELLTIGSALHWVHRERFVSEASRVTTSGAYLLVHDHGFTGQMDDTPEFGDWMHHRYQRGYPAPPRGEKLPPGSDLGPFRFAVTHRYDQAAAVTRDELAGYLTTQSNLQVAMTTEQTSADVMGWLEKELDPFFPDASPRVVHFAGIATILQRV